MNYLGHAYLSFGQSAVLAGNMIGDHVKGLKAIAAYPEGMQQGIRLHRSIDQYTDEHAVLQPAKDLFRGLYGLYAGAITDTLMDYFLANDPDIFPDEKQLLDFTLVTYRDMAVYEEWFPLSFGPFFESMRSHNWLYHYRSKEGIRRSLTGLQRRAKHMPDIGSAFEIFERNERLLATCYRPFINDIISFVKIIGNYG